MGEGRGREAAWRRQGCRSSRGHWPRAAHGCGAEPAWASASQPYERNSLPLRSPVGASNTAPQTTGSQSDALTAKAGAGPCSRGLSAPEAERTQRRAPRSSETAGSQLESAGGQAGARTTALWLVASGVSGHGQKLLPLEDQYIRIPGMLSIGICRTPSLKQESPG